MYRNLHENTFYLFNSLLVPHKSIKAITLNRFESQYEAFEEFETPLKLGFIIPKTLLFILYFMLFFKFLTMEKYRIKLFSS